MHACYQVVCIIKLAGFIELNQACGRQPQVVVKLVHKTSAQSTCIKPVDNLQQTCYHQAGASDETHPNNGLVTARL